VDADTGQGENGPGVAGTNVAGKEILISADYVGGGDRAALMAMAVLVVLVVTLAPPLVARRASAAKGTGVGRPGNGPSAGDRSTG
jgi:hypothetical protein